MVCTIAFNAPFWKEITYSFYFGSTYSEEDSFIFITNDDVINIEQKIQSIDQEHVFIFKENCTFFSFIMCYFQFYKLLQLFI